MHQKIVNTTKSFPTISFNSNQFFIYYSQHLKYLNLIICFKLCACVIFIIFRVKFKKFFHDFRQGNKIYRNAKNSNKFERNRSDIMQNRWCFEKESACSKKCIIEKYVKYKYIKNFHQAQRPKRLTNMEMRAVIRKFKATPDVSANIRNDNKYSI